MLLFYYSAYLEIEKRKRREKGNARIRSVNDHQQENLMMELYEFQSSREIGPSKILSDKAS